MKSKSCSPRRTITLRRHQNLPQHIVDEILDLLDNSINFNENFDEGGQKKSAIINNNKKKSVGYWLKEVREAKSAQQEVYILRFDCNHSILQQRRRRPTLSLSQESQKQQQEQQSRHTIIQEKNNEWVDSMELGKNRLVLRIWKGGSRWWNLNRNESPHNLAKAEIMGYQIARNSFDEFIRRKRSININNRNINNNNNNKGKTNNTRMNDAINYREVIMQNNDNNSNNSNGCDEHHNRTGMRKRNNNLEPVSNTQSKHLNIPKVPRVLYFRSCCTSRLPEQKTTTSSSLVINPSLQLCWAVLEYVGPDEDGFLHVTTTTTDIMRDEDDNKYNNDDVSNIDSDNDSGNVEVKVEVDESYLNGMTKIRTEFGFDEPHPRWGRIPVDQALQYARVILREVTIPLHCYSSQLGKRIENERRQRKQSDNSNHIKIDSTNTYINTNRNRSINDDAVVAQTYSSMVRLYRQAWKDVTSSQQHNQNHRLCCDGGLRIKECLKRLERGLEVLEEIMNNEEMIIPPLDSVLVHLDLQPQNIIFGKKNPLLFPLSSMTRAMTVDYHNSPELEEREEDHSNIEPKVLSVFDWEDAAWADPRFDLILLCRKVCANRNQANVLWSDYANAMLVLKKAMTNDDHDYNHDYDGGGDEDNKNNDELVDKEGCTNSNTMGCSTSSEYHLTKKNFIGPIKPWLQLETVHSITTMLLQSTDLLGGGRNPWETKNDLWGKLLRELTRLEDLLLR